MFKNEAMPKNESIPQNEAYVTRSNNPHGQTLHPEDSYNLEDDSRDREDAEKESKKSKGTTENKYGQPYVPIEEVEDEDAEQAIYNQVEAALQGKPEEDSDEFGYFAMMNKIVGGLNKKERNRFLADSSIFLPLHEKIVNDEHLSDEEKDRLLRDQFTKIFGHQVSAHNPETRVTSISMHKPAGYKEFPEKTAPPRAFKPQYIEENGRPLAVDPNDPADQAAIRDFEKKQSRGKSKFGMFFRRSK